MSTKTYKIRVPAVLLEDKKTVKKQDEQAEFDTESEYTQAMLEKNLIELIEIGDLCETSLGEEGVMQIIDGTLTCVAVAPPATTATKLKRFYRDHLIVSETDRTVEGHTYTHVGLDDGTELDLTDEEVANHITQK